MLCSMRVQGVDISIASCMDLEFCRDKIRAEACQKISGVTVPVGFERLVQDSYDPVTSSRSEASHTLHMIHGFAGSTANIVAL